MQTQNNEFLATEPIGPLLRKLAIPTITAQLISIQGSGERKIVMLPGYGTASPMRCIFRYVTIH